jgi:glycine hydroxymethyltransferase
VAGLIAGGVHPSPVGVADVVTFTTHKTLRGPRGGCILTTAELAPAIDRAIFPGTQGGPLEHVIAGKAVAFAEAAAPGFAGYARPDRGQRRRAGERARGEGFRIVSGGTDNHLVLVDLRPFDETLTGKAAQTAGDASGITFNKNQIPNDTRSAFVTSGIRLGTPAVTTAGMTEGQMPDVARLLAWALRHRDDPAELAAVRAEVAALCATFPPYR